MKLKNKETNTIENETKEQRGGFLGRLLGTLGASLLGNLLAGGESRRWDSTCWRWNSKSR